MIYLFQPEMPTEGNLTYYIIGALISAVTFVFTLYLKTKNQNIEDLKRAHTRELAYRDQVIEEIQNLVSIKDQIIEEERKVKDALIDELIKGFQEATSVNKSVLKMFQDAK